MSDASVVLKVDRKFLKRYAEGYVADELVATSGDALLETTFMTSMQYKALDRLINSDGLSLLVTESGQISILPPE